MTFAEMVAEVIKVTVRPDMGFETDGGDGRIVSALQSSLSFLHAEQLYFRDIRQGQLKFNLLAYVQTFGTASVARWRQLAYARKDDPTLLMYQQNPSNLPPLFNSVGAFNTQQSMAQFYIYDVNNLFDNYNTERLDVGYQAGDAVFLKSSSAFQYVRLGWYTFPNLDYSNNEVRFDSFIARDFPWAAIYHSAATIFSVVGQQDQTRMMNDPRNGIVTQHLKALRDSNILAAPLQGSTD